MIRSAFLYFLLLHGLSIAVYGQDLHLTQFYANPVYLNPAFTGANVCNRAVGTYRNQWPGISKGYVSYIFAADHYFKEAKSGLGVLFSNDVAGTGSLRTTTAMLSYAYETQLSREWGFRAGVQGGAGFKSVNVNDLLFGDQIARGGNVSTIENINQRVSYFDSNAGVLFYNKDFWGGISVFHLNRPNESLMGNEDLKIPRKWSVHLGRRFEIDKDNSSEDSKSYFTPVVHYRHQNKFDQLDVGFYLTKAVFNLGIWYRGIPLFKAYQPGYANNDALALLVGFTTPKFSLGYSYDITISKLSGNTAGAHEICMSYQFCRPQKKKYRLIVPCPKF